jgi:hypothetical protein
MKNYQRHFILGISALFIVAILAVPFLKTQASNNNSIKPSKFFTGTRNVIQIGDSKWAPLDSTTFDSSIWVWANMTNGGRVTDQQIPENAEILSIDVPIRNVTATDRTNQAEVFFNVYQSLPESFNQSRNPIYLGSTYQYLIFLPIGSLQRVTGDGVITKTEIYQTEKLGSAIVYSGSQDGNGVLLPTYMDGVLYNPADFNSLFSEIDKFSYVDATDNTVIPTMHSFSTPEGKENYAAQNYAAFLMPFGKLKPVEITNLSAEFKGYTPCYVPSVFWEDKNYRGAAMVVPIGSYAILVGTWWDKRISSVITAGKGKATTLSDRVGSPSTSVQFLYGCLGTYNLRSYDFNDKTSVINVR